MFLSLSAFIGLRYTRAKRRNHFISFISLVSLLGIALGVTILITVLSVMNGFDYQIRNHLFKMVNQVTVSATAGGLTNWDSLSKRVIKAPGVKAAAPFVTGQGMLTSAGSVHGVMIQGVLPQLQDQVSIVGSKMVAGSLTALKAGSFGIVLGQTLADSLNVQKGDNVILLTPKASLSPIGILPRFRRFKVVGIFHVDGSSFDAGIAYINLHDAQALFQLGNTVNGLRLKVNTLYDAPKVSDHLTKTLSWRYVVTNWTQQYGNYFKAIQMEKTMMFILLLFIIAIAAFNLVSSLVMTVTDKQADIAILRTLGADSKTIMAIFIFQGSFVGILGTFIGVIGGILLALNAPALVSGLQNVLHTHFISAAVYFIDYLPSKLDWHYIVNVSVIALILSVLATIYPAYRASRVQPAEALRYE